MTEADWVRSTRTNQMLRFLIGADGRVQDIQDFPACKGGDRKLRLFACACYHRIRCWLPDSIADAAVQVAERYADGEVEEKELQDAERRVRAISDELEPTWRRSRGAERSALAPTHTALSLALVITWKEPQKAAYYGSSNASLGVASIANPDVGTSDAGFGTSQLAEERSQCDLLRDIFGAQPFRPLRVKPEWLSADTLALATAIYSDRAFDRMPILADALEEAGCDDRDVLAHCRGDGPHVRGCWVVDLLLGKS